MVTSLLFSIALLGTQMNRLPEVSDWSAFPGDAIAYKNGENVHDPCVFHFGNKYFCVSTSGNGFGVMRESTDLSEWKVLGPIFDEFPDWLTARYRHHSLWAPNVQRIGNDLRMYYCMSNWGTNESVIGFAECKNFDPEHPMKGWQDRGLVFESKPGTDTFNAIDPEIAVGADGKYWMFFGSYFAGLYTVQLDAATGKLANPSHPELIAVASNKSERGNPLEATAIAHRGDYFYLFTSYGLAGQGVKSTYRLMVGRSKNISGPYLDDKGVDMTQGGHLNVLNSSTPMFSPGHCHVFQDVDGRWLMPYHYYDSRRFWVNGMWGLPTLQIRELLWTPDGWPLPGMPLKDSRPSHERIHSDVDGNWIFQADFGNVEPLKIKSDKTFSLGERISGTWSRDKDQLVLKPNDGTPFTMYVAYGASYLVGRNGRDVVVRAAREK